MKFVNKILAGALAVLLTAGISVSSQASEKAPITTSEITINIEPTKTEISTTDLPSAVKSAISSGDYTEFTVESAYEINADEDETQYEVHFVNEYQQQADIVIFDKEGREL